MLFIYTSYTANIVALLQSTTKDIVTLEDLFNAPLDYGIEDTPYTRFQFADAKDPIRKTFYDTKINLLNKPSKFTNMSYGVSQMRKVSVLKVEKVYCLLFKENVDFRVFLRFTWNLVLDTNMLKILFMNKKNVDLLKSIICMHLNLGIQL